MNSNSLPIEFKQRMQKMLKKGATDFFDTFSMPEYVGMRINTLKQGSFDAVKAICGKLEPVLWCKNGYYADKQIISGKHPYHVSGLVYFQEPSAMAAVSALGIKPGDFVLDLCAAPGGKATQAAEKLRGKGVLVANEIVEKRSKILAENIIRFGIKNAVVTNENPSRLAEKFTEFFDKIIVDAPCSGEGMFKKTPAAITEWSIEHTHSCAVRQKKILEDGVKMLKCGGDMVYSTCTFAPCENEGVIDWLLSEYPELELKNIELPGLCDANGEWVNSKFNLSGAKRIFPHLAKGEGHFLALIHKNGNPKSVCMKQKSSPYTDIYREFEAENLNTELKGNIISFGERLFMLPQGINTDDVRTPLAGLFLGTVKKGRFEPSHALCLALSKEEFKRTVMAENAAKYFHGEVQKTEFSGWTAVTFDSYTIGWGKGADGILKNHFPKNLRF